MIGRPPRLSRAPPHPHFFRFPETHLTIGPRRNHRPCSSDSRPHSKNARSAPPSIRPLQTFEPTRRPILRLSPTSPFNPTSKGSTVSSDSKRNERGSPRRALMLDA